MVGFEAGSAELLFFVGIKMWVRFKGHGTKYLLEIVKLLQLFLDQ